MGMLWDGRWETLPLREYFCLPYDKSTDVYTSVDFSFAFCFWNNNGSVFFLKSLNYLTNQIQNLAIGRTALIFGKIVQLIVQLRVNFNS